MKKITLTTLIALTTILIVCTSYIQKDKGLKTHFSKTENSTLTLGFVKVIDMAPLAIAKEKGFFTEEGLDVDLWAYPNWKYLHNDVVNERLQGAMLFSSQAIASEIGVLGEGDLVNVCGLGHTPTPIILSTGVWNDVKNNLEKDNKGNIIRPFSAKSLKTVLDSNFRGKMFQFGMTYPVSTENYHLRYWLAEGGIHPGFYSKENKRGDYSARALLSVTPPPQMPKVIEYGTINGYATSEPWGQKALTNKVGTPVLHSQHIQSNIASKSLALSNSYLTENKETAVKLVKAIIKACIWLDDVRNREEACEILSQQNYLGTDKATLLRSFGINQNKETDDVKYDAKAYSFYKNNGTYPSTSDAIWLLTQMRRWGQIHENHSDKWYQKTASKIQNTDVWSEAITQLKKDNDWKNKIDAKAKTKKYEFIDGVSFDAKKPNAYLKQFKIGMK